MTTNLPIKIYKPWCLPFNILIKYHMVICLFPCLVLQHISTLWYQCHSSNYNRNSTNAISINNLKTLYIVPDFGSALSAYICACPSVCTCVHACVCNYL